MEATEYRRLTQNARERAQALRRQALSDALDAIAAAVRRLLTHSTARKETQCPSST